MTEQKDALAAEVKAEAKKRAARKRAAKKAAPGEMVEVVMVASSRGVTAGETRAVPKATAERLIRQGHARAV